MKHRKKKCSSKMPNLVEAAREFSAFIKTIAKLRDPTKGCPWDLDQTHLSLRPFMLEEAHEAVEVMTSDHQSKKKGIHNPICEELGDVLLQVILNAQVATDNGTFSIADVARVINEKIIRRHPHVFGGKRNRSNVTSAVQVKEQWDQIKKVEKGGNKKRGEVTPHQSDKSLFTDANTKTFPSTLQALRIGKIAESINFDWPDSEPVFRQLTSEVQELERELTKKKKVDLDKVKKEIGDVYFTLAQLCRHLKVDPETAALDGNRKFLKRFSALEGLARKEKVELAKTNMKTLEALWIRAKKLEN